MKVETHVTLFNKPVFWVGEIVSDRGGLFQPYKGGTACQDEL